jgi:hypothetical protein
MQVLVRNVPPDPDESVNELVEHFFLVNHPEHYLTYQVWSCSSLYKQISNYTNIHEKLWMNAYSIGIHHINTHSYIHPYIDWVWQWRYDCSFNYGRVSLSIYIYVICRGCRYCCSTCLRFPFFPKWRVSSVKEQVWDVIIVILIWSGVILITIVWLTLFHLGQLCS